VQPGDLVRITRASIGIPKNTIGLVVEINDGALITSRVQLLNGRLRRYLTQDLRKVR